MKKNASSDIPADTISWSARFSVGVASLDRQHQRIIDMINSVITHSASATSRETIAEVLNDMIDYAETHLRTEEALLLERGYPGYSEHTDLHSQFRESAIALCQAFEEHDETVQADLLGYLKAWWVEHILVEDMKYKDFLGDSGIS